MVMQGDTVTHVLHESPILCTYHAPKSPDPDKHRWRCPAQFPLEPSEEPVPCACGAQTCRGRLN